jgi:thiamine-monophosphate kinase
MSDRLKEDEFIEALRKAFPESGLGDDAAVDPRDGETLLATDAVVEGVHFRRDYATLSQAVQKLVTSNVSDIYAMGGKPRSVLFTAGLPSGFSSADMEQVIGGLHAGCAYYDISLAGGDTVFSPGGLFFNIAVAGGLEGRKPLSRKGAKPGDSIVLFGECGGSSGGLLIVDAILAQQREFPEKPPSKLAQQREFPEKPPSKLAQQREFPEKPSSNLPTWERFEPLVRSLSLGSGEEELSALCEGRDRHFKAILSLVKQHLVPVARPLEEWLLEEGEPCLTAAIDVSDGIARDLRHLCRESGVGAELEESALRVPEVIPELFEFDRERMTEFVLSSGEEYVMLATVRGDGLPAGAVRLGRVITAQEGLVIRGLAGERRDLPDTGYQHEF